MRHARPPSPWRGRVGERSEPGWGDTMAPARSPNEIVEPLIKFWSELRATKHPRDEEIDEVWPQSINTDFAPTPFVGDLRQARVFVLLANAGYHPQRSPQEFEKLGSAEEYRERLRNPGPCEEGKTHPYFLRGRLGGWLKTSQAAVVNAMAYRSPAISREPEGRAFAEKLPSVRFHRDWLYSKLLPGAARKLLMVIVHRPGLWKLSRIHGDNDLVVFTNASRCPYLPNWVADKADAFLDRG
jgi:hypothetical protein